VFCAVWEDVFGVGLAIFFCIVSRAFIAGFGALVNVHTIFEFFVQNSVRACRA
jgi:hypothetical protein